MNLTQLALRMPSPLPPFRRRLVCLVDAPRDGRANDGIGAEGIEEIISKLRFLGWTSVCQVELWFVLYRTPGQLARKQRDILPEDLPRCCDQATGSALMPSRGSVLKTKREIKSYCLARVKN
jgi:hypothetical protein